MTHSHDTSTPAVSAETVPSEEFVLVPLAECPIGLFQSADGELCLKTEYGNNEGRIDAYIVSSGEFFWGAAPQTIASQRAQMVRPVTLSASHLAKEGGEAGVVEEAFLKLCEEIGIPATAAAYLEYRQRFALPQPSPALAKGGDASEPLPCPFCGSPAKLIHPMGDWIGREDGYAPNGSRYVCSALYETPSRECNTFGVPHGPNQDADALIRWNTRAALSTPTEGPASQTEGMGGDARDLRHLKWSHMPGYGELSMDQLREAVSKAIFADRHHMGGFDPTYSKGHQSVEDINYNSLNRIVTAFVRAALTPSETAEAVPVGVRWRLKADFNGQWGAGPWVIGDRSPTVHGDTIESEFLYSHPAPATGDRERLVEALPKLDDGLIRAALEAHYGKKAARELGIMGVDLTAGDVNWPFRDGFRRMWAGIRKELKRRAVLATEASR